MGFLTLTLICFFSILLRVSSYRKEYCTEIYDPSTCTYNLDCLLKFEAREIHYYSMKNNINGLDYENLGYVPYEHFNCKIYFEFDGLRMKPIKLTLRNFETELDNSIPVCINCGYDLQILKLVVMLDLSGNSLLSIPNIKSEMSNLKTIKISNTGLTLAKLSNKNDLPSLEELDLSSNKIAEVRVDSDQNEYPFRGLKMINLSDNNLESVPNLEILRVLEDIDLSHNNIELLGPITFEGIKDLIRLNLSHNRISEINSSLFRFTKLKVLNLKFNKIEHINTNDFDKLTMLEILDLSSNLISSLEKETFSGMNFLKELNMRNNEIALIDEETFTHTQSLKFVDLSANKMKSLPKDLFRGKNVQNISVQENSLEGSLMRGMFDGLTYVSNLDLSYQFLDAIEDYAFYGLHNLEILSLHYNNITILTSKSFRTLKKLKDLDLSFNKIPELMFEKEDLYSLEKFNLKCNHLSTVNSNSFDGMTSLRYLDLSNNKINHIEPNSFKSLHNLVNFAISNNPLDGVLNDGTFDGLNSLPQLDISTTLLTVIQNNSFCGMNRLIILNVSHSKINTVQYNAFSKTGSIYSIDLSFNAITEFFINTTDLSNLGALYLNNNNIKFLPSSLFHNVPDVSTFIVSFNDLEEISPLVFSETNNLETVDFSYNEKLNFNTSLIENMKKIKFLSLSGIKKEMSFGEIDIPVTELVISNSSIKDVESLHLNNLKQLNTLILSHNNITKLEYKAFANISALRILDVSFNSINYIQPGTFKDNSLLFSLNISHNSLNDIAYGILSGLINLNTMDMSYNHISSLQNERFYGTSNLKLLIVDHNNIESFALNDFDGTNLLTLSLGNNPIPCETLVNFKQRESTFDITAITLDEHNDENVHGIICNKKNNAYSRMSKHYTNVHTNGPSDNSDSVLINIRDIILDKLNTQTNNKETINNEKYFLNMSEKFTEFAESNNVKVKKIIENTELLNTKLVNLTSQNLNAVQTSINKSDKTNLLLEKILRVLSNKSNTTAPLTKDNATYENLLQYINKIKQEIDDDMSFEKRNIMDEVESKIANLKSNNASLLNNKIEHLEQKSTVFDQSIFTETCVVFILIILIIILLFLVYKSGIFVRKSFSISTRELPSAMDSTL